MDQLGFGDIIGIEDGWQSPRPIRFDAWGEVFEPHMSSSGKKGLEAFYSSTQFITLWGNGKINLNRADDLPLCIACEAIIGPEKTDTLLTLRRKEPELNLNKLLDAVGLEVAQRKRLQEWLAEESQCYCVWLDAHSSHSVRSSLSIIDAAGNRFSHSEW